MELQGKKATHDFLSLYKDSSFQHHDPARPSHQGFFLKTHDFLQPLERERSSSAREAGESAPPAAPPDINLPAPAEKGGGASVERVLPGGIGTYSITHVPGYSTHAAVKPEWPTSPAALPRGSAPAERRVDPTTTTTAAVATSTRAVTGPPSSRANSSSSYSGGAFTLWEETLTKYKGTKGGEQQWSTPYASRSSNSSFASLNSSRNQQVVLDNSRRFMDTASKSSKGFTDDDEDEDDFGKRDGSSLKELRVKVDGKNNSDKKVTTPRSKHSATEQRRRSKINDRFQILRDLIPHSDQKRDKASFLLEVIEYIQFLQEKVQKYESDYPGWNQDGTNMIPWVKVLFRSFWENARQKNPQSHVESIADPSQVIKNGSGLPSFAISGDNTISGAPVMQSSDQTPAESENVSSGLSNKATSVSVPLQPYGSGGGFPQPQPRLVPDFENMAYQSQSLCMRSGSATGVETLDEQELAIDEGTISISSAYSQGLLHALTQALQSSGIDMSQASISVQINLGKRAFGNTVSNPKDQEPSSGNQAIGHSRVGSNGIEETEQANKRRKQDKS